MKTDQTKAPRLYCDTSLGQGVAAPLGDEQSHYLLNVMRRQDGDHIRAFNGRDGEWMTRLVKIGKKSALLQCEELIAAQYTPAHKTHLFFAPIKKDRLSFLIEKSVELGVTDLHPVISDRTENRHLNFDRLQKQIIEAAEQCERTDIPVLHDTAPLASVSDTDFPVIAAIERDDDIPFMPITTTPATCGYVTGPEGGWTASEIAFLKQCQNIRPVHLGRRILRAETAIIYMLARGVAEEV